MLAVIIWQSEIDDISGEVLFGCECGDLCRRTHRLQKKASGDVR